MSVATLRKRFMPRFQGLSKYPRAAAWLMLGWYFAQIIGAIFLGNFLLERPAGALNVAAMVLTAIFIGTRLRGLNNIVHECTHYSFSDHREDNVRIGSLCASVLTGCFHQYRDEHMSHHAYLGDYERDLDLQGIRKFRLHEPLTARTILRHVLTPLLGLHLRTYAGVNLSARDGRIYQWLKVALLVSILVFTVIKPLSALFFVILPLFYIFPTLNYWTDCLDHAGVVGAEDELDASRNILAPKPLRYILFPRNDCFHLVHHLFPKVPARHLETAHRELCADPEYRSRPLAVRARASRNETLVAGAS